MKKISIIHPSRSRPEIAEQVACTWLSRASNQIEYIMSLDSDDAIHYAGQCEQLKNSFPGFKTIENDNRSAIDAINNGAKIATGDLFIVVSDDFDCPENWDTLLLKALQGKEDYCVKTLDGIQPTLMTLPIMDRKYYNRFGYIYHPDYRHMYSDQEMTAVAHMLGRVITLPIKFEHKHYSTGKFKKDEISTRNDKTYPQGKEVFIRRLRNNFGILNPVCSYKSIKWH